MYVWTCESETANFLVSSGHMLWSVKHCEHLAYWRRFWAGRHTLSGLHHNYVTRTRAGKNLTLSATTKKTHTHRRKPQWSLYSRMANSSAVRFSPIASDVVELAEKLALASNSIFIGTEHLLQALLTLPNRYPLWHMYYDFGKGQKMETYWGNSDQGKFPR